MSTTNTVNLIKISEIIKARQRLNHIAVKTQFVQNYDLSEQYGCTLFFKREDLQVVRSYKIRGAYNMMASLDADKLKAGIVCASAGNHAQGVALAAAKLGTHATIYMPETTPGQKIKKVRLFGREHVDVVLIGDTFDDAFAEATAFGKKENKTFIPPFDDRKIITGQGTVAVEIIEDAPVTLDYIFVPIGGGGLIAGVGSYLKQISPETKIIGVEPAGAPAMHASLKAGKIISLDEIDPFVDGAAVRTVGKETFQICQKVVDDIVLVPEGKVCTKILQLYNEEAIVVEPAGALSVAALDFYKDKIKDKNVCCIISGGNNDITRTEEIKERSLLHEGLKHYFIIRFAQRAGALREFVNNVLGAQDNITHFQYTKKNSRESGPALVGIELQKATDYKGLVRRMEASGIQYEPLNDNQMLFDFFV